MLYRVLYSTRVTFLASLLPDRHFDIATLNNAYPNYVPIEVISPWGVRQRRAARGGGCECARAGLQSEGAALGAYGARACLLAYGCWAAPRVAPHCASMPRRSREKGATCDPPRSCGDLGALVRVAGPPVVVGYYSARAHLCPLSAVCT